MDPQKLTVHEYKLQVNQRKTGKSISPWCQKTLILLYRKQLPTAGQLERKTMKGQAVPKTLRSPSFIFLYFFHTSSSHTVFLEAKALTKSLLFCKQTLKDLLEAGWDHPTHQMFGICCVSSSRPSCMWRLGCTVPVKLSNRSISWKLGLE